jgi:predicted aconitase
MSSAVSLTDDEKRMLQGEDGVIPQVCMQYLVDLCRIAGAERLVDLDGTGDLHTPGNELSPFYGFTLKDLEELAAAGAHFKIPTFANKSPFPEQPPIHGWESCDICAYQNGDDRQDDPKFHERAMHEEFFRLYRKMGMMTSHSCANYLTMTYFPSVGQHCSWFESSQIPYCNATLGARTNIDGSFATCFLGKAPYYGMHVTENRYGTVLVKTDRLIHTDLEWDVFGFAVGADVACDVPVLTGTAKPTTTQYQKLNSAIHTGGGVAMYHIPGATPEAPTVEWALGGRKPRRETLIGERELKAAYDTLNYRTSDTVDMVYLGCPHLNVVDLMLLARKLEGKKVRIPTWIMTAPWLYDVAKNLGYRKIFENAGAKLMSGACLAAMGAVPEGVKNLAVDTAKQAYYITGRYPDDDNRLQVCYGSTDDCIDAALTGRWHGEWR